EARPRGKEPMIETLVRTALFLTVVVAFVGSVCYLVGYAWRQWKRRHFVLVTCSVLAVLAVLPLLAIRDVARQGALRVVPPALHVDTVAYQKEESWGFGPGGNEAGIRVFPLSDTMARRISAQGMAFFNELPLKKFRFSRDPRSVYSDWRKTPIQADAHWRPQEKTGKYDIYDYICKYGLCIDIDAAEVQRVTRIVNAEGSYYAYGRIGLIVVSPREKLVVYMYNG
ncbi:MAG TPA: hypothetical protein VFJ15_08710, partial [Oleiagrimonas sp.]|nr:hypothetical protein [Oleiagrimonas sp.]